MARCPTGASFWHGTREAPPRQPPVPLTCQPLRASRRPLTCGGSALFCPRRATLVRLPGGPPDPMRSYVDLPFHGRPPFLLPGNQRASCNVALPLFLHHCFFVQRLGSSRPPMWGGLPCRSKRPGGCGCHPRCAVGALFCSLARGLGIVPAKKRGSDGPLSPGSSPESALAVPRLLRQPPSSPRVLRGENRGRLSSATPPRPMVGPGTLSNNPTNQTSPWNHRYQFPADRDGPVRYGLAFHHRPAEGLAPARP